MTRLEKNTYAKFTGANDREHDDFLDRISKTLYYTKLPVTDCLSLPVTELAAEIFTEVQNGQTLERLDVEEASRISRNACVSPCSLVLALLYLERLKDCNPEYLQRVAPSELFLVTLMVASKFLNDDGEEDEVFNSEWAKSGDLSITQMNRLERDFLKAINWTIYVHNQEFWERLQRLERDVAYKEARKRGWFSYTDLNSLLDTVHLCAFVNTVIHASTVFLATYTIGVLAVLGSSAVATYLPKTLMNSVQHTSNSGVPNTCNNNLQYVPKSLENSPIELEEQVENMLFNAVPEKTGMCNKSYFDQKILDQNFKSSSKENGWEWLVDSITYWLPTSGYSNLKNCTNHTYGKFNNDRIQVTDTGYMIESNFSLQNLYKKHENRKKKIFDLTTFTSDWRFYISYLSKTTLSY